MIFEVVTLVVLIIAFIASGFLSFYLVKKSRARKFEKPLVVKRREINTDTSIMEYQTIYDEYIYLTKVRKSKRIRWQDEVYVSNKFDNIIEGLSEDSFNNLNVDTNSLHVELFSKATQQSSGLESETGPNKLIYDELHKFIEPPQQQFVH